MEEIDFKTKSEGVKHCCYGTCNSDTRYRHRDGMKDVFFIPFPKPTTKREICERWIKACGRPLNDFNVQKIKRCTYICSKHFIARLQNTRIPFQLCCIPMNRLVRTAPRSLVLAWRIRTYVYCSVSAIGSTTFEL